MDNTHEMIKEILHKQQVFEYLNTDCTSIDILSDAYANEIVSQCMKNADPSGTTIKKYIRKLIGFIVRFSLSIFLLWLTGTLIYYFLMIMDNSQPPLDRAEAAIEIGDYDTARTILTEQMTTNPLDNQILISYIDLCQLEEQHDEAALTLIDYLNHVTGTQNIQKGNKLYTKLKELTGPFSPDVETAYQECLNACEASIEIFNFLDTLIKNEKYQMALHLCDSMQQENVSEEILHPYYDTCYTQLEE